MRPIPAACAIATLVLPVAAWAGLNMRPGLWETTMKVGGNAMPAEQQCYLQKDIEALDRFQRGLDPLGYAPCRASDYKEVGNRMSYTLTCEIGGRKTISAVTTTYDGDRITGTITGLDSTISTLSNTRIGPCSESSFGN